MSTANAVAENFGVSTVQRVNPRQRERCAQVGFFNKNKFPMCGILWKDSLNKMLHNTEPRAYLPVSLVRTIQMNAINPQYYAALQLRTPCVMLILTDLRKQKTVGEKDCSGYEYANWTSIIQGRKHAV